MNARKKTTVGNESHSWECIWDGTKEGREYRYENGRWFWTVWDNGRIYARGVSDTRGGCDAAIDNLCPI